MIKVIKTETKSSRETKLTKKELSVDLNVPYEKILIVYLI